jgi:hypothetical protein
VYILYIDFWLLLQLSIIYDCIAHVYYSILLTGYTELLNTFVCDTLGSHSGNDRYSNLLGYYAAYVCPVLLGLIDP